MTNARLPIDPLSEVFQKAFTFHDMKPVFIIVVMENSPLPGLQTFYCLLKPCECFC